MAGLGNSCGLLPLQDITFLEMVAFALFSDPTLSNIEFFNLETHVCV